MTKSADPPRSAYAYWLTIPTRWKDNDIYGHVNNVVYYSYFDTVINTFLIRVGGLDIHDAPVIGVCAESSCRYRAGFSFPDAVVAGLRVEHLGRRSVRYGVGLFREGADDCAAVGDFVHVFVERATMAPVAIPEAIRAALADLAAAEGSAAPP